MVLNTDPCSLIYKIFLDHRIKEVDILKTVPPEIQRLIQFNDSGHGTYDNAYYPFVVVPSEHIAGIPKIHLLEAFKQANSQFYDLVKLNSWSDDQALKISQYAVVILLVTSENLTAINARKRLLRDHPSIANPNQEQNVTDLFLCSRLQKHTKSPLIWNYRKHAVKLQLQQHHDEFQVRQIEELCKHELRMTFVSGEYHPSNYYAWSYARWLFSDIYSMHILKKSHAGSAIQTKSYLKRTVATVQKWSFAHPRDASGWSFLEWILLFYVNSIHFGVSGVQDDDLLLSTLFEVIRFSTTVSQGHETTWCLIKRVLSDPVYVSDKQQQSVIKVITRYVKSRQIDQYECEHDSASEGTTDHIRLKQERALDSLRNKDVYSVLGCLNWTQVVLHLKRNEKR
ncbi:hypothetical protein V1514DRAFT_366770 [Lipomyces japonicus]|uniref:uncharacterized protein n=1 Tax=Lipomyces japonicus TaxID=56871 RepID=UPI0034CEC1F4